LIILLIKVFFQIFFFNCISNHCYVGPLWYMVEKAMYCQTAGNLVCCHSDSSYFFKLILSILFSSEMYSHICQVYIWYITFTEIWEKNNANYFWIVANDYAKYHHLVPNGSKVIERTQYLPYTIGSQLWSKSVTQKSRSPT
jgi:hypothetical protein